MSGLLTRAALLAVCLTAAPAAFADEGRVGDPRRDAKRSSVLDIASVGHDHSAQRLAHRLNTFRPWRPALLANGGEISFHLNTDADAAVERQLDVRYVRGTLSAVMQDRRGRFVGRGVVRRPSRRALLVTFARSLLPAGIRRYRWFAIAGFRCRQRYRACGDRAPNGGRMIAHRLGIPRPGDLAPVRGSLLGALVEQRDGVFWSQKLVLNFERTIGRKLDIDHYWYWTTSQPSHRCSGEFPRSDRERWDIANGRIPMASWTPEGNFGSDPAWLDNYIAGQADACFRRMAKALKALPGQILLRPMHEMNGNWYEWSGAANGGGTVGPMRYRQAWIHIYDIFQAEGATNVKFVWCPGQQDTPDEAWNHWTKYYPGDQYVDWVCVDGYNWFNNLPWMSVDGILKSGSQGSTVYRDYASRKPFMIGETGTVEDPARRGRKGQWFIRGRDAIKMKYPRVKAFVYFNTIADNTNWRIQTSQSSIDGFRQLALDPYFRTRG
jgi:hypothetical protein